MDRLMSGSFVEQHATLTVPGGALEVAQACHEVALDMGLVPTTEGPAFLGFRIRRGLLTLPTEITIYLSTEGERVHVSVSGYSQGGQHGIQSDYIRRVVGVLADRVEREMACPPASPERLSERRGRRIVLRLLAFAQWLPLVLVVPMLVVPFLVWTGQSPERFGFMMGWGFLLVTVPPLAEVNSRRLVGTQSRVDQYLVIASIVFVALIAIVVLAALFFGRI